jgi:zinc protease
MRVRFLHALAASALAAVMTSTALAAPLSIPHERFALKNGLTVILVEDHAVPRVHMGLRVRTGSAFETPGRTGFAHLFEHLMFEGSKNVPEGKFDEWLEAAGGTNNAWTSEDATYYFEEAPANALELMLFLESDRLGFFVDQLSDSLVDGQRDIVKNERRQSYENRPYGQAMLATPALLWPKGHPYSWPVIGSMEDLGAANLEDVKRFFTTHYAPENCILILVGDFKPAKARALVQRWFDDVPPRGGRPAPVPAPVTLRGERRAVFEDDVELPRVSITWPSAPIFTADDTALDLLSSVLAGGESSRLVRRLVHEERLAQSVSARQSSRERASEYSIDVLAFPGTKLSDIVRIVDEEVARLVREGPEDAELGRARTVAEADMVRSLDSLAGKASRMAAWAMLTGDADRAEADLERLRGTSADTVTQVAARTLGRGRLVVSVVPRGRLELAVMNRVLPAFGGAR